MDPVSQRPRRLAGPESGGIRRSTLGSAAHTTSTVSEAARRVRAPRWPPKSRSEPSISPRPTRERRISPSGCSITCSAR